MSILSAIFISFIYQPFFNLLVFIYWLMGLVTAGDPDMGIGVIILTIIIRIMLLPLSLAGHRSEAERREIAARVKELDLEYLNDRQGYKDAKKKYLRSKQNVVVGELVSLFIQVMIALMLWRVFERGLGGADFHYIYPFMPEVETPFNLVFLGRFDLSHSNLFLNLLQSFLIFIFETVSVLTSPYPPSKGEVVRLQLTLPVVSFLLFMGLPAGKKLFVITTLCFSIVLSIVRYTNQRFLAYKDKVAEKEMAESDPEADVPLVRVKG